MENYSEFSIEILNSPESGPERTTFLWVWGISSSALPHLSVVRIRTDPQQRGPPVRLAEQGRKPRRGESVWQRSGVPPGSRFIIHRELHLLLVHAHVRFQ
jgi:hypothetical protein